MIPGVLLALLGVLGLAFLCLPPVKCQSTNPNERHVKPEPSKLDKVGVFAMEFIHKAPRIIVVKLPTRGEDFSEWYNQIVLRAELADYAPVRGCMIVRPYGWALWENIQQALSGMARQAEEAFGKLRQLFQGAPVFLAVGAVQAVPEGGDFGRQVFARVHRWHTEQEVR